MYRSETCRIRSYLSFEWWQSGTEVPVQFQRANICGPNRCRPRHVTIYSDLDWLDGDPFVCECASLIRVKSHQQQRSRMATRPPRPKARPSRRTRHSKDDSDIYAALNDFTDGIPSPRSLGF